MIGHKVKFRYSKRTEQNDFVTATGVGIVIDKINIDEIRFQRPISITGFIIKEDDTSSCHVVNPASILEFIS